MSTITNGFLYAALSLVQFSDYLHYKISLANYHNSENFNLKIIHMFDNYKFHLIFMGQQGLPRTYAF